MIPRQLTLGIELRDDATFTSFFPGDNQQIVQSLQDAIQGVEGERCLYLWGSPGVGKTHLLHAACHIAVLQTKPAVYLPLANPNLRPNILENLDRLAVVCIDDIDRIAGQPHWEEALFHLFNQLRERGVCLFMGSRQPLAQVPFVLPDLKSRLAWGIVYHLQALNDEDKLHALQLRAQSRGLSLDDSVGRFLLKRCSRNAHALFSGLEALDKASLAQQRRLTIPFVKSILGI